MKKKVNHIIEAIIYWMTCLASGCGLAAVLCKILGEDAWSWKEWTFKHKVIYWIVETILIVPMTIWLFAGHTALEEKIDDELDD